MIRIIIVTISLLVFSNGLVAEPFSQVAQVVGAAIPSFQQLVGESGMQFARPAGFDQSTLKANPLLPYEYAIHNADKTLEIRYAIRPLERIEVDYEDPHSSSPDPNHMFPLMFQSLVTSLSNGGHSPTNEYPPEQASKKFGAHWAAASVFDINPDFDTQHKQALMIAMHKNHLADAYVIFLFDDYAEVQEQIRANLTALAFLN